MNTRILLSACFFLCLGLTMISNAQKSPFEKRTYSGHDSLSLPYRLLLPYSYDEHDTGISRERYPLVIFLHGSGERGSDNEAQLVNGVAHFADTAIRKNHPAFVIVPQCPKEHRWAEVDWAAKHHVMQETPSMPMQALIALIDEFIREYPVDTNRIYIAGLSMGGFGTWDLISRYPFKFAAALALCGGGDEAQAKKLTAIPIWAFHGEKDPVVSVKRSRNMIAAIRKAGGSPFYTEMEKEGHAIWEKVFSDKIVLEWLFSQDKGRSIKTK